MCLLGTLQSQAAAVQFVAFPHPQLFAQLFALFNEIVEHSG
jgi:hypothetical protein